MLMKKLPKTQYLVDTACGACYNQKAVTNKAGGGPAFHIYITNEKESTYESPYESC